MSDDERKPWERMPKEPPAAYEAFRVFRDLPPSQRRLRLLLERLEVSERTLRGWAARWDWWDRAAAWDDETYRTEDAERLDAIRDMVKLHRDAARTAINKALDALKVTPATDIPPGTVVRLLEVGTKLEQKMLTTSVAELQGVDPDEEEEDPFDRIARELAAHPQ